MCTAMWIWMRIRIWMGIPIPIRMRMRMFERREARRSTQTWGKYQAISHRRLHWNKAGNGDWVGQATPHRRQIDPHLNIFVGLRRPASVAEIDVWIIVIELDGIVLTLAGTRPYTIGAHISARHLLVEQVLHGSHVVGNWRREGSSSGVQSFVLGHMTCKGEITKYWNVLFDIFAMYLGTCNIHLGECVCAIPLPNWI